MSLIRAGVQICKMTPVRACVIMYATAIAAIAGRTLSFDVPYIYLCVSPVLCWLHNVPLYCCEVPNRHNDMLSLAGVACNMEPLSALAHLCIPCVPPAALSIQYRPCTSERYRLCNSCQVLACGCTKRHRAAYDHHELTGSCWQALHVHT